MAASRGRSAPSLYIFLYHLIEISTAQENAPRTAAYFILSDKRYPKIRLLGFTTLHDSRRYSYLIRVVWFFSVQVRGYILQMIRDSPAFSLDKESKDRRVLCSTFFCRNFGLKKAISIRNRRTSPH